LIRDSPGELTGGAKLEEERKNGAELAASCNVCSRKHRRFRIREKEKKGLRAEEIGVCMPETRGAPCGFFIPSENCKAIERDAQKESSTHRVLPGLVY
jgi:hypothetical protein